MTKKQEEKIEQEETLEAQETAQEIENQELNEVEKLQNELAELNDKYIRKVAEFDNYRKNMLRQQAELIKNGGERLVEDMLPIIDDFERARSAVQSAQNIEALQEGVQLIYDKFISFLNKNGVKQIETDGADFNTDFHEAVTLFPVEDEEKKNKIIDCVSKGYTMNDKVIRFAKVVVGK